MEEKKTVLLSIKVKETGLEKYHRETKDALDIASEKNSPYASLIPSLKSQKAILELLLKMKNL